MRQVNVDVTAPGATLALGLMFLKTNNASVAGRLQVFHRVISLIITPPPLRTTIGP